MMPVLETVFIDRQGTKVTINKSDLKPSDIIWGDKPSKKTKTAK
tara:strand:+ start:225 stop:356 length:132 start_codon:yes stop_codon:yes gene_type:complete